MSEVYITGLGFICAFGQTPESFYKAYKEKLRAITSIPSWLFISSLEYPAFVVSHPDLSRKPSRTFNLAWQATLIALEDAQLSLEELSGKKIGICLGTTVGCMFNNEECYFTWKDTGNLDKEAVSNYFGSQLALELHRLLGTRGPYLVVTNACSSGTDAIGLAAEWIRAGLCDLAIAGGADELSRISYEGFACLQLQDERPCRPFDRERQGLNLGEGAGVFILESEKSLKIRQIRPKGKIVGYGAASDAWHPTAPHPQGLGIAKAIKKALKRSGLEPSQVAYINAHGTGTKANDASETAGIYKIFGDNPPPIVSTKGLTGHTLGAAGALEAIFTLLTLNKGFTHGTVGCVDPDPSFPCRPLKEDESAELRGKIGLSLSLAFGGGNAALLLEGGGID